MERVYERALIRELAARGSVAEAQVGYSVDYKGHCVGQYVADLLVEKRLLVELKCVERISNDCVGGCKTAQCINYLKASHLRLAPIINFQKPRVEWKRIVYG